MEMGIDAEHLTVGKKELKEQINYSQSYIL